MKITYYTAGILYLFYNFEMMLKSMEKDMDKIREKPSEGDRDVNQIKM